MTLYGECATRPATTAEGTGKGAMMTTKITREERERVADLLGYPDWATAIGEMAKLLGVNPYSFAVGEILEGRTATVVLDPEDIDRVAQALRDAEGETLRKVVDDLGGETRNKRVCTMADVSEIVAHHERQAAPQWREVTETEPPSMAEVLIALPNGRFAIGRRPSPCAVLEIRGECAWNAKHWMPLPAPPEVKPAPAPAPRPIAQPGASEAARIDALERTATELALAVERLSGGAE